MRALQLLSVISVATLMLMTAPLSAQTMEITESVQQAGQRAANRIAAARSEGLPVDTAIELVAEHDKLCIVSFRIRDERTVSILDNWCVMAEGAYEIRQQGLPMASVRSVERYLMQYPERGSWETLQRDLFESAERFVYLQHLVRNNSRARQHFLSLIVGHSVSFIDPVTREIKLN